MIFTSYALEKNLFKKLKMKINEMTFQDKSLLNQKAYNFKVFAAVLTFGIHL